MDYKYMFEISLIDSLYIANDMAKRLQYNAIPNECFFAALFLEPHNTLYNMLQLQGISAEDIMAKVCETVFEDEALPSEFKISQLKFDNGKTLYLQSDILEIIDEAQTMASYYERTIITSEDAIMVLSVLFPEIYSAITASLLFDLGSRVPITDLPTTSSNQEKEFILPDSVAGFLRVLNTQYSPDEKTCPIGGRDDEVKKLTTILLKNKKRNCILVGDAGVGKTAIVEKIAWQIVTGNCPKQFKDMIVLELDVTSLISDTMYRGSAEKRFKALISFLENNKNCILFIDEIHLLLGAGSCEGGQLDLANALKPMLARGETRVIGATTLDEYQRYFSRDSALNRRFEKIIVREPNFNKVYSMIKNQITVLKNAHGVSIKRQTVETAILYASCFNFESKNPDKTLDLIDRSMAIAELNGRKSVREKDIISTFDVYTKKFDQMTIEQKRAIAYHEAGHYLLYKFSKNLSNHNLLAVSIMPAEDYLGVTVCELDDKFIPSDNEDYFIAVIAAKLAGRICEKIYTGELTSGASSDLEQATNLAKQVVTKFGFNKDFGNRVFVEKIDFIPETSAKINEAVNTLLKKAEVRAKNVLSQKSKYLEALADALVKRGILSEGEINCLFDEIDKKNN